ncbi:MAG: ABC transporter substrate-binding protein, partial [Armatimonadetes bacterium]|nr:ABC transporter substrate-binding protein [Armatimonadota bacterium]
MIARQKLSPLLVLVLAAAFLTPGTAAPAWGAPSGPRTLTIGMGSFPSNLSPGHAGNASLMMLFQFSEGLTRHDPSGRVIPALAESWRLIDDTTWEFKLRKGVKFHNGEPFTAQAVKFTYDRTLDTRRPYSRRSRVGFVTAVEVVDDYTVRMKTSAPFPLLAFGSYAIVIEPPGYVRQVGDEEALRKPVGTGPYRVVEWVPDRHLVLEANREYWDGRPKIDRVIFRHMPDASTRLGALRAAEVQIADKLTIDVARTMETATTTVKSVNIAAGLVNTYNLREPGPLQNLKVRQAIDHAIDRKIILQGIYRGYGAMLDGQLTVKGSIGYNPKLQATPYDVEKAKKLLAEAGYAGGLSLNYVVPLNYQIGDHEIALATEAQLKKVGI